MMTPGPQTTVIFVEVSTAGSPGWARPVRKPWTKPEADRRQAWPKQAIPSWSPVDRELVRRLADVAKRVLAETRGLRAAMLAL
jgi:hypothetical protein